ncbi:hypothetical protein [Microcystis phage Mvi-JY20]|uniref:Uncharacterized protein n=1 Tax=Microcystis phage Mvi-JY20 TaxID=3128146 RepID=A0AAX4QG79_9CAUD
MPAGSYDDVIEAHATFKRTMQLFVGNAPRNLTGATIHAQLRRNVNDTSPTQAFTNGSGITITDALDGKFTWEIAANITATLSGTYVYDVLIIEAGDNRIRVLEGKLTVRPAVTRV